MSCDYIKQGDCLELMKEIPDKSIDCVLCDLPYGTTDCKWDSVIPFEPLWEQYKRIIKAKGSIVLFSIEPFTSKLVMSNLGMFKEKLTWEKHKPSNFGNAKIMHLKYSEDIIVFSKGVNTFNPQYTERTAPRVREGQKGNNKQWRTSRKDSQEVSLATQYAPRDWHSFDADKKLQGNVLRFPSVVSNSKEKAGHPTQKPVALLRYLIRTYTNEGDIVLDNCMGSGSTCIAAIRQKRHYIGYELQPKYFDEAEKRIGQETRQLTLS